LPPNFNTNKKPCDGYAPPGVNQKTRELEAAMAIWLLGRRCAISNEMIPELIKTIREAFA
jgi:hypothetical protein